MDNSELKKIYNRASHLKSSYSAITPSQFCVLADDVIHLVEKVEEMQGTIDNLVDVINGIG